MQDATPFDVYVGGWGSYRVFDDAAITKKKQEVISTINGLKSRGVKICIALYPSATPETQANKEASLAALDVAAKTQSHFFDYSKCLQGKLSFSDETHLVSTDERTFRFRNTLVRDSLR